MYSRAASINERRAVWILACGQRFPPAAHEESRPRRGKAGLASIRFLPPRRVASHRESQPVLRFHVNAVLVRYTNPRRRRIELLPRTSFKTAGRSEECRA
jgi:hypothetical protein